MLLFRSEEHVERWCRTWKQPRGAILTLVQGWRLAWEWYSDRLKPNWRPKTTEEIEAAFVKLGLTSPFWSLRSWRVRTRRGRRLRR